MSRRGKVYCLIASLLVAGLSCALLRPAKERSLVRVGMSAHEAWDRISASGHDSSSHWSTYIDRVQCDHRRSLGPTRIIVTRRTIYALDTNSIIIGAKSQWGLALSPPPPRKTEDLTVRIYTLASPTQFPGIAAFSSKNGLKPPETVYWNEQDSTLIMRSTDKHHKKIAKLLGTEGRLLDRKTEE